MKQLQVIIKPFVTEQVLQAISKFDVTACVVHEAKGYSRQKGYLDKYVGSEYNHVFIPKVEITLWVKDEIAAKVEDTIIQAARTGRIGDGKVLVIDAAWPDPIEF